MPNTLASSVLLGAEIVAVYPYHVREEDEVIHESTKGIGNKNPTSEVTSSGARTTHERTSFYVLPLVCIGFLSFPCGADAGCEKDTDCKGERICVEGACVYPVESPTGCSKDTDCPGDFICESGVCQQPQQSQQPQRAWTTQPEYAPLPIDEARFSCSADDLAERFSQFTGLRIPSTVLQDAGLQMGKDPSTLEPAFRCDTVIVVDGGSLTFDGCDGTGKPFMIWRLPGGEELRLEIRDNMVVFLKPG